MIERFNVTTNSVSAAATRRLGVLVICGLMACLVPSCENGDPTPEQPAAAAPAPVGVKAVEAWSSPIRETLRLIGSTRAVDTVRITTEVTGKVEWIGFEDEQIVEAGAVLVRLDSRRAEANLRSAAARLERLRLSESRIAAAFEGGAANQSELDDIRTSVREAEADADRAQIVLDDHEIRTPFTGRVTRRLVSLGSLVDPGTTVTVLNSADPIEVVFAVPEARLPDLAVGQRVSAVFDGFAGSVFTGELVTIGAEVDPSSRSAEVYARIPNSDARLRPGMFATVTVVVGTRADAVLVPESALLTEWTRIEAFIIEDGVARRQRVRITARHSGIVEIAEGIQAGQTVVTGGLQRLREGTEVTVTPDDDLAALGVVPGLPLDEQPVTLGKRGREAGSGDNAAGGS